MPEATSGIVASLAQHRVLSTEQVRAIHHPDNRARWTQRVLARLRRAGLVDSIQPPRAGQRLWFATEDGVRLAREAHALKATPRPLEAREVAGQLQAHTLAVNDVGICFLKVARKRADECGPLSWRHEVAHPLSRGRGRRRRTLIADAVLTYLRGEGGRIALEQRFIELDRATLSADRLVAELARYAELCRAVDREGEPIWVGTTHGSRSSTAFLPGRLGRCWSAAAGACSRCCGATPGSSARVRCGSRSACWRTCRSGGRSRRSSPTSVTPASWSTGSARRRGRSGRGTEVRDPGVDRRAAHRGEARRQDVSVREVRLASSDVEALARRIAELVRPPRAAPVPRRLMTAAEVAEWWGVERSWVYAHAEELGARRIGSGERPRLRFRPTR